MNVGRMPEVGSPDDLPLLVLMRAEFTVSKRWRRLALILQLGAVGLGIAGTILTDPRIAWPLSLAALFALLAAYLCQLQAERARALAERTRRTVILAEGLGWPIVPRLDTELRLAFDRWATSIARRSPRLGENYFTSGAEIGPARLRDHLQESLFIQTQLSKRMASYSLAAVVVIGFVLLAVVLLALSSLDQQDARSVLAKALAALVPFVVTTNALRLWWNFHTQAAALEHLDTALDRTRSDDNGLSEIEVLRLLHEYDILLLQAPEVPDLIYAWHEAELNHRWAARAARY